MTRCCGTSVRLAAILFLVSAALHLVVWLDYGDDPFARLYVSDALSYHHWAQRIAVQGLAAEPVFHQSPLFPLLLSLVYRWFSATPGAASVVLLQSLLTSTAVALLVPLGRLYFDSVRAGVAAAVLALGYGPFLFYSMKLLPVPLTLATQAAGLALLGVACRRDGIRWSLAAGLLWGLAVAARAETLLFLPLALFALWRVAPRPRPWRGPLTFLLGCLALVAPLTAHNASHGDIVVVASAGGENLFIGNQRGARGGYTPLDPSAGDLLSQRRAAAEIAEAQSGRSLRPSEVSRYWARRALDEMRADPPGWLALEARKLQRLLLAVDPTDVYAFALERALYLRWLYAAVVPLWGIYFLALYGALRAPGQSWPLAAFALVLLLILMAFFVDTRLRLPWVFALLPFAGRGAVRLFDAWRAGVGRAGIAAAAVGLLLLALLGQVIASVPVFERVRLAAVLSSANRLEESLEVLAPEIEREDADPVALDQAGWVEQRRGDFRRAAEHYARALDHGMPAPRVAQTRTRTAQVLEQLGRLAAAATQHDLAAADPFANAGTFYERGLFRLRRGAREAGIEDLRRAARADPGWPAPRQALAALGEANE